jgi:hypothetical protein
MISVDDHCHRSKLGLAQLALTVMFPVPAAEKTRTPALSVDALAGAPAAEML